MEEEVELGQGNHWRRGKKKKQRKGAFSYYLESVTWLLPFITYLVV